MATKISAIFDDSTIEKVKKAIGGDRKVFESLDDAKAAFEAASTAAGDGIIKLAAPDAVFFDGEGKNAKRIDGINAAVAVVGTRQRDESGKMSNGIKAVVLFPIPSTEAFLANANGESWVAKVIEKEASHVAYRGLRNAETVEEFESEFGAMPRDVDAFVSSHTRGGGLDTDAFDEMWPQLRQQLRQAMPKVADLLPQKQEVLRAIRSKPYALEAYNKLETAGKSGEGLFVYIAQKLIEAAPEWEVDGKPKEIDASAIQAWLDNRETLDLRRQTPDESVLEGLDLGF